MSDVSHTNPNIGRVAGLYFAGVLVLIMIAGEAAFIAFDWPDFLRGSPTEILTTLHPRVGLVYISYYLWVIAFLAFIAVPVLTWRAASHPARHPNGTATIPRTLAGWEAARQVRTGTAMKARKAIIQR